MFMFISFVVLFLSDAVIGQATFSKLKADDSDSYVSFGSGITFTVNATHAFSLVDFIWIYKNQRIATVSRNGGSVTTSNLMERVDASANITDANNIKLSLKLLTILDDNGTTIHVQTSTTSSNQRTVRVKACEVNGISLKTCGLNCKAHLNCGQNTTGETVKAICQRNATFSDSPRCVSCNTSEERNLTQSTDCKNGSYAICPENGSPWKLLCKTESDSDFVACNTDWCTLDPKYISSNDTHVRLICPDGKIGDVTAYRLEGEFYGVEGTCQDIRCTESQLRCGNLKCTVKDLPYGYKENVTAECPDGFYGNVTAVCGENNAYKEINSFCTSKTIKNQRYILPTSFGVFGGSLLVGIVIGLFVNLAGIESKSQEFRLQLRLSPVKFVFLLIAFLVWGFAAGFLLFVYLAQYWKRKHKGQESNGDKRHGYEHQTTTN